MTDLHTKPQLTIIEVRNPADGFIVGEVPVDTPEAVAAKAAELRLNQPEWEAMGAKGRKPWLLKFQEWILDNAEHITDVVQSESGKPRAEASTEAPAAADGLNYWARNAEKFLADKRAMPHTPLLLVKRLTTVHRPYPLVGMIAPWNFPFAMAGMDVPPALAAGAAVLLKPSEVTPLSGVEFVRGMDRDRRSTGTGNRDGGGRNGRRCRRQRRLRSVYRVDGHRPQGGDGMRRASDPLQPGTRR